MKYFMAGLGFLSFGLFFTAIFRNMIVRKSIAGWLFPGGTTKKERVFMFVTLIFTLSAFIMLAILS